jgi:hypothetical protein
VRKIREKLRRIALREREETGCGKRKNHIALCGEFALEEAMDVS